MSSDPVVKIHQHYLNISKTFGLFRKSYIGIFGPDIEILVSEFTTYESVRIFISVPKKNQITEVNKPNLLKYITKNCPMLGSNWNGKYLAPHFKKCSKCTSLLDLTKDYKKITANENLPIKSINQLNANFSIVVYTEFLYLTLRKRNPAS